MLLTVAFSLNGKNPEHAALVSTYQPFHSGHEEFLNELIEDYGKSNIYIVIDKLDKNCSSRLFSTDDIESVIKTVRPGVELKYTEAGNKVGNEDAISSNMPENTVFYTCNLRCWWLAFSTRKRRKYAHIKRKTAHIKRKSRKLRDMMMRYVRAQSGQQTLLDKIKCALGINQDWRKHVPEETVDVYEDILKGEQFKERNGILIR